MNEVKNITEEQNKTNIAIRVVVDHVRAVAFAIADGQLPSNTGAGYVIRRILRRAVRYGYQTLKLDEAFIYQLVAVLEAQMGEAFPELSAQKELINDHFKEEERLWRHVMRIAARHNSSIVIAAGNDNVLAGIDAALEAGLTPLKINCVIEKGMNEGQILPLTRYARDNGLILRFIEFMDVGATNGWRLNEVLPSGELVRQIHAELPLLALSPSAPGETAERWCHSFGCGLWFNVVRNTVTHEIGRVYAITEPKPEPKS